MEIQFKKTHQEGVLPQYSREGDAGLDLTIADIKVEKVNDRGFDVITVDFGIACKIPEDYVGLLFPRSSIYKYGVILSNSVGVVDSNYTGSIMAKFYCATKDFNYKIGDRGIQLIIIPRPYIKPVLVDELPETNRGTQGFGSSGN